MKIKLTIILLALSFSIFGQNKSPFSINRDSIFFSAEKRKHQFDEGDTLYTSSGYKFYHHQVLKIGAGSGEKGYFKYIFLVDPSNTDMSYAEGVFQSIDKLFLQGSSVKGITPTYQSYNSSFDLTSSMAPTSSGKEFVVTNLKKRAAKKLDLVIVQ